MIKQKELVPKRRFEGLNETWKKEKFGHLYDIKSGNAFNRNEYVASGVPIINGESIHYGRINTKNLNYLPKEYIKKFSDYKILPDDIVLGLNRPIINDKLKIAQVPKELKKSLLYQRAGKVVFIKAIDIDFTYHLLGNEIYKFVLKEAVGSDQPFISTTILKDWELWIPKMKKEQQKIGQFFKHLDDMIALEQRKIDKTKALKSAYLAEMFPVEGERTPKRRFSGFTDEWRLCSLGDLTKINTGDSDLQDSISDGKYPFFVRSENIQRSNRYTFNGEAILIPGEGRLGEIYHHFIGKFDYHQRVYKISNFDEELDGKFTLYTMHKTFKKHALKNTVKATVDSLRLPVITEYKLLVPTIKEQKKIGNFFKSLDNMITVHEQKLDKLKATKQAYLHEMFV